MHHMLSAAAVLLVALTTAIESMHPPTSMLSGDDKRAGKWRPPLALLHGGKRAWLPPATFLDNVDKRAAGPMYSPWRHPSARWTFGQIGKRAGWTPPASVLLDEKRGWAPPTAFLDEMMDKRGRHGFAPPSAMLDELKRGWAPPTSFLDDEHSMNK